MNPKTFFDQAAKIFVVEKGVKQALFPGCKFDQKQVDGINLILDFAIISGTPLAWLAYMLATAAHETRASMQPVIETWTPRDIAMPTVEKAIARLDAAYAAGKLSWVSHPYWRKDYEQKSWLGRGLVQLTHKFNYEKLGPKVGVGNGLLVDPARAMDPLIAVRIMFIGMEQGLFTGRKLSQYENRDGTFDYYSARKIINSLESADRVRQIAIGFEGALKLAGYNPEPLPIEPEAPQIPTPPPVVIMEPEVPEIAPPDKGWVRIVKAIIRLLKVWLMK